MQVSEIVQQFVTRYITSVDQLEMLLLLRGRRDKDWTAEDVAKTLFTQPEAVVLRLEELRAHGIVAAKSVGARNAYRYQPQESDMDRAVEALAVEYPIYRVTIINLIFSKPIDKIRTFADAFRLKKEDEKEEDNG